jgi:hypothetical protein
MDDPLWVLARQWSTLFYTVFEDCQFIFSCVLFGDLHCDTCLRTYDLFFLAYDIVPYIHFHRPHPPVLHSASSALGSVNKFFIQLIALGGQTTATTFPFTNPSGTGPNILPSLLQSRLSPANQQCPSGTWNISSFTSPPTIL